MDLEISLSVQMTLERILIHLNSEGFSSEIKIRAWIHQSVYMNGRISLSKKQLYHLCLILLQPQMHQMPPEILFLRVSRFLTTFGGHLRLQGDGGGEKVIFCGPNSFHP